MYVLYNNKYYLMQNSIKQFIPTTELNEAMKFAKKENGALARIIRLEDGTRYVCWYDLKCLGWSD